MGLHFDIRDLHYAVGREIFKFNVEQEILNFPFRLITYLPPLVFMADDVQRPHVEQVMAKMYRSMLGSTEAEIRLAKGFFTWEKS
jgi:hypothetical protein